MITVAEKTDNARGIVHMIENDAHVFSALHDFGLMSWLSLYTVVGPQEIAILKPGDRHAFDIGK